MNFKKKILNKNMEAKIMIHGMSPSPSYLKTNSQDYFSLSFLHNDNYIKIDNLENYLNKKNPINIPISNLSKRIIFYLIKNGTNIIGNGEITLINGIKWFDLKEFNNKTNDNLSSLISLEDINNRYNSNKEKDPSTSSFNNDSLFQEIINNYNIKFKFSIEIINEAFNNLYIKQKILQKPIGIKTKDFNSSSNNCSSSKTPKNIRNSSIKVFSKKNKILKNKYPIFKKIDLHPKTKSNNCSLFSSINNKLLRNQTEKKLFNKKKENVSSFNDYYNINYNKINGHPNLTKSGEENMLNLTNDIFNKRKNIIISLKQPPNGLNENYYNSNINNLTFSYKKINNKSNKKTIFKRKETSKNHFMPQNENKKDENQNAIDNYTQNIREKNMQISYNSFKKIEDVIIDQNFKNEIKNDEFLGLTTNNDNSNIDSNINKYDSDDNIFYNKSCNNHIHILDIEKINYDNIIYNFININNEVFCVYTIEYIKSIKKNLIYSELNIFIHKVLNLENEYQKIYKELYLNLIIYKKSLALFQFLYLCISKKKNKLDNIKISLLLKENKKKLMHSDLKSFNNQRNINTCINRISFLDKLLFIDDIPINNSNHKDKNINRNKEKKKELVQIFLDICKKNKNYFN